ncbi:hypothetical protein [Kroppenstedtia eburnea]|uniref:Uncharacterized protein n=1 Tax=Kroppenstedtia eburnea TaxID=714067 RepID=A0A1N7JFB3_9BACL|nr:hypothetical protein [Kroppenstedtia eburnea]QKI80600.1 hypothetical protein GXN75_00395 [Kroppenstedtia eburnea]SIS47999.1 hypothetical protein SAMN05421790_10223 [Kroppenstedtia eburnea]
MRLKQIKPMKFNQLATAQSFANRCQKIQMIILGDDDKFWVVSPREAKALETAGYQLA